MYDMQHDAIPMPGVEIPQAKNNIPTAAMAKPDPGHQWVAMAVYGISQQGVELAYASWMAGEPPTALQLDHENLITVQGPGCLKCSQPLNPSTFGQRCPVTVLYSSN